MTRPIAVWVLVLGSAGLAHAQVDRATLSGTVRDPQGAVVAGASVSVTNSATNVAAETKTNTDGNYTAVNLAPGRYVVAVEAGGFHKGSRTVVLEVGQRGRAGRARTRFPRRPATSPTGTGRATTTCATG